MTCEAIRLKARCRSVKASVRLLKYKYDEF